MQRTEVNGFPLEYEFVGLGEPVLLIHGSPIADAFRLMIAERALIERHRLVHYHRRGYTRTLPRSEGWATIADHAADARELLRHLGIERTHVVGYDVGGLIALQMALDAPGVVHSLALLEPVLMQVPSSESVAPGVVPAIDLYQAGDRAGAVRALIELGAGPDSSEIVDTHLPGSLDRAAHDAGAFFEEEFLAIVEWELGSSDWAAINQPALSVLGEHSIPFFLEGRPALHTGLPQAEDFDVFNATHLLPIEQPEATANGLLSFFSRHPLQRASP